MSVHTTAAALASINYAEFYIALGVPPQLAHLAAEIEKHEPVLADLSAALERKADLTLVWPRFALWLFEIVLVRHKTSASIAELYRRQVNGEKPREAARSAAAQAAVWGVQAAEATAVWAAKATAVWAADADAEAAAWAVRTAVWAAADADAETRPVEPMIEAAWKRFATKLKDLLAEAP